MSHKLIELTLTRAARQAIGLDVPVTPVTFHADKIVGVQAGSGKTLILLNQGEDSDIWVQEPYSVVIALWRAALSE